MGTWACAVICNFILNVIWNSESFSVRQHGWHEMIQSSHEVTTYCSLRHFENEETAA